MTPSIDNNTDQLIRKQEHGLERELAVAEIEKILQRRPEEVEDHRVVVAFGTEPPNERNADTTSERLVDFGLVLELGVLGLDGFELDGNFFS